MPNNSINHARIASLIWSIALDADKVLEAFKAFDTEVRGTEKVASH